MTKTINCLPPELLLQVLTHLPAKDLLTLRVVCKLWNSIICDRSFHQHHLHQLRKKSITGCNKYYISFSGLRYGSSVNIRNSETLETIEEIKLCKPHCYYAMSSIKGSVDGVLLAHTTGHDLDDYENVIFLWNPAIRKVVDIPLYGSLNKYSYDVGFGFDSVSNVYKVVALYLKNNDLKTKVYILGNRSWISPKVKRGSIDNVKYLSKISPYSLNFEGCVYWPAKVEMMGDSDTHYLCFNLSTEAFICSKLPDAEFVDGVYYLRRHISVLYESLALVDYFADTDIPSPSRHIRVWIRRKDNTATSVFSCVELYNLDCYAKCFIYLTNNGNLYLQLWSLPVTFIYDLKAGKEKTCSDEHIRFMDGYPGGSLALLR